jgi:hypothetical protein
MRLVRERLDFDREGDSLRKIGIGQKRPGQFKDFHDVKKGDTSFDYNGEEGKVIDTMEVEIGNSESEEEFESFISKWDSSGAMYGFLEEIGYEPGDTEKIIAINDPEDGMTYVFTYSHDGAYAVW